MTLRATPLITCIIPAWNAERFLGAAIDSVLAQSEPVAELIVVDDGSTDGTAAVAQSYEKPVRLIQQRNSGTAAARDTGIRVASHDLLTFLDADDLIVPEKLERQLTHLLTDKTLDVSMCHGQDFWDTEVPASQRRGVSLEPAPKPGQMSTWLIWRSAFARFGLLCNAPADTRAFGEASGWYMEAKHRGLRAGIHPDLLVRRRLHLHNKTRQDRAAHLDAILALAKRTVDQCRKGGA